ncbi:MAG: T9SS type A sorting domain-containing protein, partial [Bacteroidetes bacterium]|nr:T9SS type A sorting domain-containing protein [Bacteroidota bacterium]
GDFTQFNGVSNKYLIRLNSNGTVDTTFQMGTGFNDKVSRVIIQPDGKILVSGNFTSYNGTTRRRIARINTDGSLDATFNPGSGFDYTVRTIALQADGKIIAGGYFSSFNGSTNNGLIRLNSDGTKDNSFDIGTGFDFYIYEILVQPDGKIVLGGDFEHYNGTIQSKIMKLYPDGTIDESFDPGSGFSYKNYSLALQPDGKIIAGGDFTSYNMTSVNHLVRINNSVCYFESALSNEIAVIVGDAYENEAICVVTVDTIMWKNKIVWEKTPGVGTESFNIYKEVSTNIFNWIGNVLYDSASFFIDYNSMPESHGDKYRISVTDTCGNTSPKSPYHKTMNLTIASFGSTMGLNWDTYVDESGQFVPSKYFIYRGSQPDEMALLDSVSGSFTSYNDVNIFDIYYYMIGVEKPNPCNANPLYPAEKSYSNNKRNFPEGYSDNIFVKNISIYPNPFTSQTTISFGKPITDYRILITDPTGKVVFEDKNASGNKYVLQRGDLESGMYLLEITNEELRITRKLVIN